MKEDSKIGIILLLFLAVMILQYFAIVKNIIPEAITKALNEELICTD